MFPSSVAIFRGSLFLQRKSIFLVFTNQYHFMNHPYHSAGALYVFRLEMPPFRARLTFHRGINVITPGYSHKNSKRWKSPQKRRCYLITQCLLTECLIQTSDNLIRLISLLSDFFPWCIFVSVQIRGRTCIQLSPSRRSFP